MDDFGTGFSSLALVGDVPASELKIDRRFVAGLHDTDTGLSSSRRRSAIVHVVCELGRQLELDVVAEGIETPGVLRRVVELGCDLVQGFLVAEPLPADLVVDRCRARPWMALLAGAYAFSLPVH